MSCPEFYLCGLCLTEDEIISLSDNDLLEKYNRFKMIKTDPNWRGLIFLYLTC